MPNAIKKVDGGFEVYNKKTGKVHAKHTTKEKAEKQLRLLQGVEHGWKPTGKKKNGSNIDYVLECLTESKELDDLNKVIKVIKSVKNEDQAEVAEKMIDNWGKLHSKDKALTIGKRTVFDVYGDYRDLKTMLNNICKEKGIKYKATK